MHLIRVASFAGLLLFGSIPAVHAEYAPSTSNASAPASIILTNLPMAAMLPQMPDAPPDYDGTATFEGEQAPIDE
jgi:hypothetical protein